MGCTSSIPKRHFSGKRKKKRIKHGINEVVVFVPELQIPMLVDLVHPLRGSVSKELIDRLISLRNRVVSLVEENDFAVVHDIVELQLALEDYLPVVLGLTIKECNLESLVKFKWRMLSKDEEETCLASAWYEVLSVVHLMATLYLLQANLTLIQKESLAESEKERCEDSKPNVVDFLLQASGCLDYCVRHVMVHLPLQIRKKLPNNLQEGVLEAISIQTLAQGLEIQLGLALKCEKATLSVKRRLACETVTYITQAHYALTGCDTSSGSEKKLLLFIQWKYLEAKAAAYYYHGRTLVKGSSISDHIGAVCCLFAAEELLRDSKRASLSFCLATPVTRILPDLGIMKHLNKKIPEAASKKAQMYGYLLEQDKVCQSLPELPEFQLSLKPDDYELPKIDVIWDTEQYEPQIQSLKEHLREGEDINAA